MDSNENRLKQSVDEYLTKKSSKWTIYEHGVTTSVVSANGPRAVERLWRDTRIKVAPRFFNQFRSSGGFLLYIEKNWIRLTEAMDLQPAYSLVRIVRFEDDSRYATSLAING